MEKIKILHLEDSAADAELIARALKKGHINSEIRVVATKSQFKSAIRDYSPDIILSDHSLAAFNSFEALKLVKEADITAPFILVTATMTDEFAAKVMKDGADDYIIKDRLHRLPAAILNLMEKHQLEGERDQELLLAKESLEKSEKRFRALIENSLEMITLTNPEGEFIYGSPSITKVFGYSPEEFLYRPAIDFFHPDDIPDLIKNRSVIAENPGSSYPFVYRIQHKQGNWIWCEGTLTNMLLEPGINALVTNFKDISERKKAEQEREFDSNNLNALINSTNDLMWSVGADFNLITSNQPFDELVRSTTGEATIKGKNVLLIGYPSEMQEYFRKSYERAFSGESFTDTRYFGFPVGIWTEVSYFPIKEGDKVIGTACRSRNITDIKQAEQQIRKSEAFSRGVLNSLSAHIAVTNRFGNIVAANTTWKRFALANGENNLRSTAEGSNYLEVCERSGRMGDRAAIEVLNGIKAVMDEKIDSFNIEYPCHSANEQRWFDMCAIRFESEEPMVVVSHQNITERKLAEENVLQSEARLKQAQAIAHFGSYEIDFATNEGIWSEETCRIYGLQANETIQSYDTWLSFIHPEDIERVLAENRKAQLTLSEVILDYRIVLHDGSIKHLYSTSKFVLDQNGNPVGVHGVVHDVTGQALSRKKIEESEKRYRQIVETAQEGIWLINKDNETIFVNKKMCDLLEYTEEEMMGRTNFSFKDEAEQKLAMEQIERRKKGVKESNEARFITKSGKHILTLVSTNPVLDEDGSYVGALAMMTDITERKVIEDKLSNNEFRLREAEAMAHVGNFEADLLNSSEVWSDEMFKIYGLHKGEAVPSKELFLSFIHPDDHDIIQADMQASLRDLKSSTSDFRFMRKDGALRYGYSEVRFEVDKEGNPVRAFGILQDITERKSAEIERSKLTADLIQRNKDLEQFSYIISHNLRAPVANIMGIMEMLSQPANIADKEMLDMALNDSVKKLDGVVMDLNHILEVKTKMNEINERVILSELVTDIKLSIDHLLTGNHINIAFDFSEVDEIYSIKSYLYSIFYNLISNSIKYCQKNKPCNIAIKSRSKEGKFELVFSDNGMGIDMEKRGDQVFGLYKRFHTDIEGKGMGLFMVKTQVETIGGKISVKSEVDKGTEFKIEIEKRA